MSAGAKILDGLKAAVAGDFSSVTINGQRWVRQDKEPDRDQDGRLCFMAEVRNWVMVRRPGCVPFTMPAETWRALRVWQPLPKHPGGAA